MLRDEGGWTKRYIVKVEPTSLEALVSPTALRQSLGLSEVVGDVVIPAPASRIVDSPLLGMAVYHDDGKLVAAHRVLLLVRGTEETQCDPISGDKPLQEQTFKVTSKSVSCLLSNLPLPVDLAGYCDFKKMMACRLDKEAALILASAVAPGSASTSAAEGGPTTHATFTIEHMSKVSRDEAAALAENLPREWQAILTSPQASVMSPPPNAAIEEGYWTEERASKVRRIMSEPHSPI